jgi:3-phosphoshikimate 1-carboxyvinyltransferase
VRLNANISSQFCSALLLIAPLLSQPLTIELTSDPISAPYIEMTLQGMRDFGIEITQHHNTYTIAPQCHRKKTYLVEGDFSSASYFFAFAALHRRHVTITNLNPESLQADRKFLDILASMGNRVQRAKDAISIEGSGVFPLRVNMQSCPDQVMTLAVLAAFAQGTTHIEGVRSLRIKETERVLALKHELEKMGISTEDTYDTLTIHGGSPRGASIETYNDHRIAMAFAIAPNTRILQPEVVNKTFPGFWQCLNAL